MSRTGTGGVPQRGGSVEVLAFKHFALLVAARTGSWRPLLACLAAGACLLLAPAPADAKICTLGLDLSYAQDRAPSPCSHFDVPGSTRGPIAPGPGNGLTVVGSDRLGSYAARLDGDGRLLARIPLFVPAGRIGGMTQGPDGAHWFTAGAVIGRITPEGALAYFVAPGYAFEGIVAGPDGFLWFPTTRGLGRMGTNGQGQLIPVRARLAGGITVGRDGALWFTALRRIGRLTPGGQARLFGLPRRARADGPITSAADGNLWFVNEGGSAVGRMSRSGQVRMFRLAFRPTTITRGPDQATVWASARAGRRRGVVLRITTRGFSSRRPRGIRCDRRAPAACWTGFRTRPPGEQMSFNTLAPPGGITVGGDGRIWFAEGTNVGRILPIRPVTVCAGNPKTSEHVGRLCTRPNPPEFRMTNSGAAYIRLTCPRFTLRYCAGTIELVEPGGTRRYGLGHFVLTTFDNPKARVRINAVGQALIRRRGRLVARAVIRSRDAGGLSTTSESTVTILRPA
jgi:virginiamycin B lyase